MRTIRFLDVDKKTLADAHNAAFKVLYVAASGTAVHFDQETLRPITRAAVNTSTGTLAQALALLAECVAWFNFHRADAVMHLIADANVTTDLSAVAAGVDQATGDTLATALKAAIIAHMDVAGVHNADGADDPTASDGDGTLATLRLLVNDCRAKLITHYGKGVAGDPMVRVTEY